MLSRRTFTSLAASTLAAHALHAAPPSAAPQLSVMMWTLKDRGTFDENLDRVALAGYHHIELVDEWKHWSEAETTRLLARMQQLGITVDATAGLTLGFANPATADAFLAELRTLIPIAQRLRCPQVILLSGKRLDTAAPGVQHQASIDTLKRAADILHTANLVGVIEPIDRLENPTIYLDGVTEAFDIAAAVGSPSLKVLYDLYHEQRGLGNLTEKLQKHIADVGLIHIADVPGRHQPGTGEINFPNIYKTLAQLGYTGILAMEFYPSGDIVQTLRHARMEITGT